MMELLLTTTNCGVVIIVVAVVVAIIEGGSGGGHCVADNLNVIEHLCSSHKTYSFTYSHCLWCQCVCCCHCSTAYSGRGQLFFCCSFAEILNSAINHGDWQFQVEINRK